MNFNNLMHKANQITKKIQHAAIEAAPQAKKAVHEIGTTAGVFVAALKNKPEMANSEVK